MVRIQTISTPWSTIFHVLHYSRALQATLSSLVLGWCSDHLHHRGRDYLHHRDRDYKIVRRSPPRRSPPQTFTTSDVHHPLCEIRRSPPQTFTTSDVHHLRRSPPQTFTTPDVHHPQCKIRCSPPQTFTTPDVHHLRHSPPQMFTTILNAWMVGEFFFWG